MTALARKPYALILALVAAFLTDGGLVWLSFRFGVGSDYEVFWHAVRTETPYVYSPLPYGSPPTTLLFLSPLKLLPLWGGLAAWNGAGFALLFWFGSRLYGRDAALLGSISPPVVLGLVSGQISLLVGSLVFAAFLSGPILCGILLGAAFCAKPQMVFFAPLLFLFAREVRPAAAFCITAATIVAVATLAFGPLIWGDWVQGMHNLVTVAKQRGALLLTVSPMTYGAWLGFFSVPAALLGTYACRNLPNSHRAAAVIAASLFAAPYSMIYDLAPLAFFAATAILRVRGWRSLSAALTYSGAIGALSLPCLWPALRRLDVDQPA